ncbi:MAG: EthD domain-containing protein [Gammaproteobacteria bacterium]
MIKTIGLVVKKPGMDDAAFHRHWREVHGPLALNIKTMRRYVQSHRTADVFPGFEDCPYHGIAEAWWDDLDTALGLASDPDYLVGCRADEPNFIDMDALAFLVAREHVFIAGPPIARDTPLLKAVFLLRRRLDLSVAEFQDYWINGHAPQIPRDAGILRYVQCHQAPETYAAGTPPYDGMAELSFADYTAFLAYWTSDRIQAIFAADAPRFLDAAHCTAFLAEETRVLWPD